MGIVTWRAKRIMKRIEMYAKQRKKFEKYAQRVQEAEERQTKNLNNIFKYMSVGEFRKFVEESGYVVAEEKVKEDESYFPGLGHGDLD